ncbi:MAG TPA: ABC transporter permease, partial [Gemmatimonadaceae bacterium]|nr:ABC transporter permease [Gemmatimonadaceae bacterium]
MSIFRDLRYAARTLLKNPMLIIVATIALGLGIGATATVWSICYGILLKGLPYEDAKQIVAVSRTNPSRGIERTGVTAQDFADYRAQQHTFEKLGASACGTMNVSGTDRAERYSGCWISNEAMTIPRVNPIRGRLFSPGEDTPGGERVAIIGYAMWKNRFA